MKLHLLGINGPFPESRGATSGYLLESGDTLLQFDLGSGVLANLTALTAPESVSALLISHWHFDHTADVPVLMYRLQALNRVLKILGPADPDSALYRSDAVCRCLPNPCLRSPAPCPGCRVYRFRRHCDFRLYRRYKYTPVTRRRLSQL